MWVNIPSFNGDRFFLLMVAKKRLAKNIGRVLLGFRLIFFGLYVIEESVAPLRQSPRFANWMLALENPVKGVGIGALVTLIIQSSSATVGMVIALGAKKLITITAATAVMLGAELGTCVIDSLENDYSSLVIYSKSLKN